MNPLSRRLAKLEAERTSGWHAWRDVPVQQWPDAALYSHLGLSADCTNAELQALMHAPGRPQGDAAGGRRMTAANSQTRLLALEPGNPGALLDPLLDAPSETAHAAGLRVLQGHRFAETEAGHVSALLRFMDPPQGATVLDIGCGFGEVARLMREERPDLAFVLLNRNAVQMRYAPRGEGFQVVLADMHALPLADASVDGAMFNYALCHADQPVALAEAARVVRPGGFLFIFDFERVAGDNGLMERTLYARAHTRAEFKAMSAAAGWSDVVAINPAGDDTVMQDLLGDQAIYAAIFSDLRPIIWKARKDQRQ